MEFSIKALTPEHRKTGCLVLGVHSNADTLTLSSAARAADQASHGAIKRLLKRGDLAPRAGATLLVHDLEGIAAERVLLVNFGVGKTNETAYRDTCRAAALVLRDLGAQQAIVTLTQIAVTGRSHAWNIRQLVGQFREVFYRFEQLKTLKKSGPMKLTQIVLVPEEARITVALEQTLKEALATADGTDLARTLGNLPGNLCTPTYLAEQARKLAREFKLGIEVLEQRDMEKLGMGALLSVTRGSRQPPKLIVLRYLGGAKKQKPLVLVGKGITFDTGGISLKPGGEMDEMKFDMSGAGSVLGTLRALAGMRAPVNVIGVIPTCENMPDGNATRPGDVVTTLSGQTVEILNTDAEGRLILCDALTYAERFEPEVVVDIATLTGACVIALGHVVSGLFANDNALAHALETAGDDAWDRVWRMPLWEDYQAQLHSNFADMANIGGRPAGSVTAACYLARFTKKMRWAHLDIAGTAWKSGRDKGSTGRPVPLLTRFALRQAGAKD